MTALTRPLQFYIPTPTDSISPSEAPTEFLHHILITFFQLSHNPTLPQTQTLLTHASLISHAFIKLYHQDPNAYLSLQQLTQQTGIADIDRVRRIVNDMVRNVYVVRRRDGNSSAESQQQPYGASQSSQQMTQNLSQWYNQGQQQQMTQATLDASQFVYKLAPLTFKTYFSARSAGLCASKYPSLASHAERIVDQFLRLNIVSFNEVKRTLLDEIRRNLQEKFAFETTEVLHRRAFHEEELIAETFRAMVRDGMLQRVTGAEDLVDDDGDEDDAGSEEGQQHAPHQPSSPRIMNNDADNMQDDTNTARSTPNASPGSPLRVRIKPEPLSDDEDEYAAHRERMLHADQRNDTEAARRHRLVNPRYANKDFHLDIYTIFRHWQAMEMVRWVREHHGAACSGILHAIFDITKVQAENFPQSTRFVSRRQVRLAYNAHNKCVWSQEQFDLTIDIMMRHKLLIRPFDNAPEVAANTGHIKSMIRSKIVFDHLCATYGDDAAHVHNVLKEKHTLEERRLEYETKMTSSRLSQALQKLSGLELVCKEVVALEKFDITLWTLTKDVPLDDILHQLYYTVYTLHRRRESHTMEIDIGIEELTEEEIEFWEKKRDTIIESEMKELEKLLLFEDWP